MLSATPTPSLPPPDRTPAAPPATDRCATARRPIQAARRLPEAAASLDQWHCPS
ncbi:hypothetical protein ABU549_002703 [Yersinia enterocolitica]